MSTTIRVSEGTRDRLNALARSTGRPVTQVVEQAVDVLERAVFFEQLNRRYTDLRDDPEQWSELERERDAEESSLGDASV